MTLTIFKCKQESCEEKFLSEKGKDGNCPKCKAEFDPELVLKSRRARSAAAKAAIVEAPKAPVPVEVAVLPDDEVEDVVEPAEEKEDAEVLEDTSDLATDDDQVAEVRENIDENPRE